MYLLLLPSFLRLLDSRIRQTTGWSNDGLFAVCRTVFVFVDEFGSITPMMNVLAVLLTLSIIPAAFCSPAALYDIILLWVLFSTADHTIKERSVPQVRYRC